MQRDGTRWYTPPPRPLDTGGVHRKSQHGVSQKRGGGEGAGGGLCLWNLGSARGPFSVKKRPLSDENALPPWFGEPVVCTLDSRGFRHFRGFREFRESSTQLLVCSCLSCLCRFRRFRDFRRFRERRLAPKP